MSYWELEEHGGYLHDERKMVAYRDALAEVIRPGDVMLDLGAGSGVLGHLALLAGAERIVSVEAGDIIELARAIAAANGFADRVEFHQVLSTELQLDERVHVVVCDQIGGLVHDAGVLGYFADAERRLTVPDARFVPGRFTLQLTPVTLDGGFEPIERWRGSPAVELELGAGLDHAHNCEWRVDSRKVDIERRGHTLDVVEVESTDDDPVRVSMTTVVETDGAFTGWLGTFEAQLSPSVALTNAPWSSGRFNRWCNLLPIDHTLSLCAGDELRVTLDLRPELRVVTWETEVLTTSDGGDRVVAHRSRRSTFLGGFLTLHSLAMVADQRPVPRPGLAPLARRILDLAETGLSVADIVEATGDAVPEQVASADRLRALVRSVLAVTTPAAAPGATSRR